VRTIASIVLAAALALLAAPEFPRYAAERRVGLATAAFRELVQKGGGDPEAARRIRAVGELALSAVRGLPGDPRPWMVGASSYLVTGDPERALEFYREAFSTGERAEIDLNLGRAYSGLGRADSARAAYLRAGWVSPEILASLSDSVKNPLLGEIERLTEELRAGRLTSPPPLPEDERR
jgi:tetratricopeptide (TPR) repeat protein